MTKSERLLCLAVLVGVGAAWGMTLPLTKIAVSTGHKHFGLLFWQLAIGVTVMSIIAVLRGTKLPLGRAQLRVYVMIAFIGSVLPNTASYQAAVHLPAGVLSILLSMVPIWAFPIALALSLDRFEWRRFVGLAVGLGAVLMIVLPGAEMSGTIPAFWVFIGLIAGLFYACEGNAVARWGTAGLDPIQVLWGASIIGCVCVLPLAIGTGQWIDPRPPFGAPELAQMASGVLHVTAYVGYVWLVGRAGPVFAVQIGYLVTLFGIIWAKLVLAEAYPVAIWGALALMMLGMYLVQPRKQAGLDARAAISDTER
ncbi:MAG: DMT family transporter [Tateyamaria sp.]|uniref:DMT family transporter n=1 Tax=Tateyamaria sp. TaxID=1929288 RepID=UPI00329AF788